MKPYGLILIETFCTFNRLKSTGCRLEVKSTALNGSVIVGSNPTSQSLKNMDYNSITYDVCLKITGSFEGADYDTVTGNFDGQGMSFGILQLNLKSETFKNFILNFCGDDVLDTFPVSIRPLKELNGTDSVIWAKDVMLDLNGNVKQEWVRAFKIFLTRSDVINLQKRACDKYYHRAKELCGRYGFSQNNRRHMAFFYDCAVHVWSMGVELSFYSKEQCANILTMYGTENMNLWIEQLLTDDQIKLVTLAHLRALKCKPEWRKAFFVRKATIAIGIGFVNGEVMDYRKILR